MRRPKQNVDLQRCWDLRKTGGTGIVCERKHGTAYMESQKQIQMGYDVFTFEHVHCVVLCSKTGTGGPEYCADRDQSAGRTAVGSALSDIQKVLEQNTDTQDLTFRELVRQLMQDGEYTDKRTLVRQVFDRAFGDVAEGNSCLYKYCF